MQPLTGSQRQIVTDPELGCNKDCWRTNPDGSANFDYEPTINYLYPLRRREFMAESRQRYQDAVARALALRIPGLDAVPPFLSRIVPLGCAMHHYKKSARSATCTPSSRPMAPSSSPSRTRSSERLKGDKVAATRMKDGDEIAVIVLEDAVTNGEQWKLSRLRRVRSPTRRQLTRE